MVAPPMAASASMTRVQRPRECAVTGADLDDGAVSARDDADDDVDDAVIMKEVLAELVPAQMRL